MNRPKNHVRAFPRRCLMCDRGLRAELPEKDQQVTRSTFTFHTGKAKQSRRAARWYLLRSNLTGEDPAVPWTRYVRLTQIETAFRSLKSQLGIRPIYHQLEHRAHAHVLIDSSPIACK